MFLQEQPRNDPGKLRAFDNNQAFKAILEKRLKKKKKKKKKEKQMRATCETKSFISQKPQGYILQQGFLKYPKMEESEQAREKR